MAIFNSYVKLPEGIPQIDTYQKQWDNDDYHLVMTNIAMENPHG